MSTEQLQQAHELLAKIEEAKRLQAAYREAGEVVVGIPGKSAHRLGFVEPGHKLTLTADEIGGQVVSALERRIAAMREDLRKLGVA